MTYPITPSPHPTSTQKVPSNPESFTHPIPNPIPDTPPQPSAPEGPQRRPELLLVVQLLLRSSPQIRQRRLGISQRGVPVEGRSQELHEALGTQLTWRIRNAAPGERRGKWWEIVGKFGKNMENMVEPRDFTSEFAENSEVFFSKMSARTKRSASKRTVREFVRVRQCRGFLELGSFPHNQLTSFIFILPLLAYTYLCVMWVKQ